MSQYRAQAPWEFLLSASRTTLQSFELSRLAHAANLRKEIGELLDQYCEESTSAMLARWLIEQRERSVLAAEKPIDGEAAASNGHSASDNIFGERVPLPRAARPRG
jgi:hypothetical protein